MKKLSFVIIFAFMASLAQAQLSLGVKGGMNITNMSLNKDVFAVSNRTGYYIGPTAKITIPVIGLGLEMSALFDQRESEVEYGGLVSNYIGGGDHSLSRSITQKQIAIPMHLILQQGLGDFASYMIFAGPQFGFNVSGNEAKDIMQEAYGWDWKDSNLSINIGVGLMLLNHFMVSVNYNIACDTAGEFNYSDITNTLISTDNENKLHSWQLGITYYF